MAPKSLVGKKGQIIHSQAREIIHNVMKFMREEATSGITIPVANFRERVLAATGVSSASLHRVEQMANDIESQPSTSFSTPRKARPRKSRKQDELRPAEVHMLREMIHEFHIVEKKHPTLKCILQKMKDTQLSFTGGISTLRKVLLKMGFKWKKTQDNRSVLMESYDIRLKRTQYLKSLIQYRAENRPIIYVDETYLHSSHTQPNVWSDGGPSLKSPVGKGKRLIIVHAGGREGFVPNALLIFKSGKKSGDYHDDMNFTNFSKWAEQQLIPNLPPRSVVVVDNASYHNVRLEKSITTASKKAEMVAWLVQRNIQFNETATKPELYDIIKSCRTQENRYRIDVLFEQHGHNILRLPPYHPELNPIEKVWASVKNWVAANNVTFKLDDVEALARQKFTQVTKEEWASICDHVCKFENELIQREHIYDEYDDSLRFVVNTGSSDEWGTDDGSPDMSGIEPI